MFTPPRATARKVTHEELQRAIELLGLPRSLLEAPPGAAGDVKRAFRVCVGQVHPDKGGSRASAAGRIEALRAARDTLLAWLDTAPQPDCRECRGTGFVRSGFGGVKPCSRCGA